MGASAKSTSSVRRASLRHVLATLVLIAVAGGGLLLQRSGLSGALVESAMNRQVVREAPPPDYIVRVIDGRGQPVPAFQIMLQTADRGLTVWETGANGQVTLSGYQSSQYREQWAIDALVRADGYASTLARFEGPDRVKLFGGQATITMRRGEPVELRFRLPQGLRWPAGYAPEVYFAVHRDAVRIMWNPENKRSYNGHMPDFNFLNVKRSDGERFAFRLARESDPFYVAVQSPGFLQFFESGPFTSADVANGILEIGIPKPASLIVGFDPGPAKAGEMPFEVVRLEVSGKDTLRNSYLTVISRDGAAVRQRLQVADLAPGTYNATVRTRTKRSGQELPPSTVHQEAYRDSTDVVLAAAETRHVDFRYAPFDPNVSRGYAAARIRIVNSDDSPAANRLVKVSYRDAHYGDLEVVSGHTSGSGELEIRGITDRKSEGATFADYRIDVDGHVLGSFRITKGKSTEAFTFHLPPRVGNVVPNIDLVNVSTGVRSKLHDLRGKVVCLELWATWCGPCQESMAKLNQMAFQHRAAWEDRVAIVPLSIDEQPDTVSRHVKQRAWDQVDHYWSGDRGATGWDAPAVRALICQFVPELLIVDRDGRILWRGNPADKSEIKDVAARINEALEH
jgi:thiol-disulfide isomerase/thioredoxin